MNEHIGFLRLQIDCVYANSLRPPILHSYSAIEARGWSKPLFRAALAVAHHKASYRALLCWSYFRSSGLRAILSLCFGRQSGSRSRAAASSKIAGLIVGRGGMIRQLMLKALSRRSAANTRRRIGAGKT